ncbi:hydroxyacyl-thioester dehydratase type 2, mitochondrial-like [Menidia menidia]
MSSVWRSAVFRLRPPGPWPRPPWLPPRGLLPPLPRLAPPPRPPGPAPPPSRGVHVGLRFSLTRAFSVRDVQRFAILTGDRNPLHLDAAFSRGAVFGRRVVHGALVTALLSALLGARLPGAAFLQQRLRFPAPLFPGEPVEAQAEVLRVKMGVARIGVRCTAGEKVVLEGEVMVLLPTEGKITWSDTTAEE